MFDTLDYKLVSSCQEVLNAGSTILLGNPGCNFSPAINVITASTAIAQDDVTASVTLTSPANSTVYLRSGSVLRFGTTEIILSAPATLVTSTPATINIQPATTAVTQNTTARTWGLLEFLAPTDIPINVAFQTVDNYRLSNGAQDSMMPVTYTITSNLQVITDPGDRALNLMLPEISFKLGNAFVYLRKGSSGVGHRTVFGRARITQWDATGNQKEIERNTIGINFQDSRQVKPWSFMTTAEKADANEARTLAGLIQLT